MIFLLKAELVAKREGKAVLTIDKAYPVPSVIRLNRYIRIPYKKIDLSRKNIMRRDGYRCQYCGCKTKELTLDHIIPKSRGGADTWDNLTTACKKCNNKKGNRTPEEAGMKLLNPPSRPNHILFFKQYVDKFDDTWRPFLFMD